MRTWGRLRRRKRAVVKKKSAGKRDSSLGVEVKVDRRTVPHKGHLPQRRGLKPLHGGARVKCGRGGGSPESDHSLSRIRQETE